MQYDLYKYEKEGVSLSFNFEKNEKNKANKIIFLELLKKAESELSDELKNQE